MYEKESRKWLQTYGFKVGRGNSFIVQQTTSQFCTAQRRIFVSPKANKTEKEEMNQQLMASSSHPANHQANQSDCYATTSMIPQNFHWFPALPYQKTNSWDVQRPHLLGLFVSEMATKVVPKLAFTAMLQDGTHIGENFSSQCFDCTSTGREG